MPYMFEQPTLDKIPPYVLYRDKFAAFECKRLIDLAKHTGLKTATVGATGETQDVPEVRSSEVAWAHKTTETTWLYHKLKVIAQDAQAHWYPFHLAGIWESVQLTRYRAEVGGHYTTHKDLARAGASNRKLSMVTLLNEPKEFEGGMLKMHGAAGPAQCVELSMGTVVVFPSWELHQVTPVTHGMRWSMVAWVTGPPFR